MWFLLRHHLLMHQHPKLRNEWTEKSSDTSKYVTEFEGASLCPPPWCLSSSVSGEMLLPASPLISSPLVTLVLSFTIASGQHYGKALSIRKETKNANHRHTAIQQGGVCQAMPSIQWREQITPRHCRFERADSVPQMKSAMKIRRQRIRTTTFAPLSLFLLEAAAAAAAAFTAFDRWPVSDLAQKCFGIHRVKDTFLLLLVGSVSGRVL